ncbi:hypothetical protein BVH03_17900 [Pseudomonas sp. PA15(2017)]|uniref:DUF3275 family protein n=1 Tax=Pseudomonas sp. PA15(2017) TaxID=1932111 RepID=UPI0009696AB0|nr:DUF3275 family protein [Pseudomonas sp. PA15(2017)]OLU25522.1 hypothetical protein BVH03_17900 [Pseudomonas sp. PA15(2017)]
MIRIDGQLIIKSILGRYGAFNVAHLITSIGEYAVKETMLEQYAEGKYEGSFVIYHIGPDFYPARGRAVFQVRARIDSMTLNEMDTLSQADTERLEQREPDLLDEERGSPPVTPATAPATLPAAAPAPTSALTGPTVDGTEPFGMSAAELNQTPQPVHQQSIQADADLFGTIWPLGEAVKLDTTVDRQRLREQSKRLDQLGYTMDFKAQLWRLAS